MITTASIRSRTRSSHSKIRRASPGVTGGSPLAVKRYVRARNAGSSGSCQDRFAAVCQDSGEPFGDAEFARLQERPLLPGDAGGPVREAHERELADRLGDDRPASSVLRRWREPIERCPAGLSDGGREPGTPAVSGRPDARRPGATSIGSERSEVADGIAERLPSFLAVSWDVGLRLQIPVPIVPHTLQGRMVWGRARR